MKAWMKNTLVFVTVLILLTPGLSAQGKGGSGGQRGAGAQRPPQGQGPGQQQGQMGSAQGQGDLDRDRLRTQATDQQRDQYRTCDGSMEQLRTQSRAMARTSDGKFNKDAAVKQHEQLQATFRNMQQEQERLMQNLNDEQRAAVQTRTQQMEQLQERISNRLTAMNQELGQGEPSASRIREQARNIERDMERFRSQYRAMGQDLSFD